MTNAENPPGTEFTPYELLFRWNDQGQLQGAHCQWLGKLKAPDGSVLAAQPMPIEAIALAEERGFPLASILDRALIDALKELDRLKAELEHALNQVTELQSAVDGANVIIANQQHRLEELQHQIETQQEDASEGIS